MHPSAFVAAVSASVETGLFGLAGVALGGLLTGGLTELRDRLRARREAQKARRLAAADLEQAMEALGVVRSNMDAPRDWPLGAEDHEDRKWAPGWEGARWTDAWAGYRGTLANELDDVAFSALARAVGSLGQFQSGLAAGEHTLVARTGDFVARVEARVSAAHKVLPLPDDAPAKGAGYGSVS
jgi:hypothetical protein